MWPIFLELKIFVCCGKDPLHFTGDLTARCMLFAYNKLDFFFKLSGNFHALKAFLDGSFFQLK